MKNSKKTVFRIISVFLVCLVVVGALMILLPKKGKNPSNGGTQDSSGGTSQKVEGSNNGDGMKAMWISYLEYQKMDMSNREGFVRGITPMFQNCKDLGLNTVIVHVRPFGDALYKSKIYPTSHLISGTQGDELTYDPLKEMIDIAHSMGLRLEAWINPYRVRGNEKTPSYICADNPANDQEVILTVDQGIYYNPALEKVREMVVAGVEEIVTDYDVDGIHFDDYFYPTTDLSIDRVNYGEYSGNLSQEDWRRENVNMLVREVYSKIKQIKPSVTFGISPQGNDDNNYNSQYSDVALWLGENGYVDYIMPQLYWGFDYLTKSGSTRFQFKELSYNWSKYKKAQGVKLYVGLGAYRIGEGDGGANDQGEWDSGENLSKMIEVIKANPQLDGYGLYRYDSLFNSSHTELQEREVANIKKANS
ncbi:MAG: family 10 glycosylhydrolase [Oscillospiraceae bacterium]